MIPYQSIAIVGGGAAGWLAACYMQRVLNTNPAAPVRITLIESPDVASIGVGEATVPTLRQMLRTIGIPETDLFVAAEATLKNGIRFAGWFNGSDSFDHPFDMPVVMDGYSTMTHWLNLKQRGRTTQTFAQAGVIQPALMDANRSPKLMGSTPYEAPITYAYHLDATQLARLLRDTARERGVIHVEGTVEHVETGPEGIRAVQLASGARYEADLYVDCTGFASLLLGKALQVPFHSYADTLLCDRAVACPVAYDEPDAPLRSYTLATAQPAGWTWDIELQSRKGTGYVYSSRFCSDDEAVATLRRYNAGRTELAEPRTLRMRVGRHERMWEKNCLALGLAAGFIEPLESTGIYLIEYALQMWLDHLPARAGARHTQQRFNQIMTEQYEELRDFVLLHYVISARRDTDFWRAYTEEVRVPERLAGLLELWKEKLPGSSDIDFRRQDLFGPHNWFFILAGHRYLPEYGIGQAPYIDPARSEAALRQMAEIQKAAVAQSPTMREYAKKTRAAAAHAPRR